jgi:hypothetical protein
MSSSRRDLLHLAAASAALAACQRAAAPGAADAGAASASPWPTFEKQLQSSQEARAALAKVKVANGDAPDLMPVSR